MSELSEFLRWPEKFLEQVYLFYQQLAMEKEACEREKWEIIQKARNAAEQAIYLQQKLEAQEQHSDKLDGEILEVP